MAEHAKTHAASGEQRRLDLGRFVPVGLSAGVIALVLCWLLSRFMQDGPRRFWLAYLHNFAFLLSLSLGGLFFVLLQHLTRSGWSVMVRRPAEIIAANLVVLAAAFVPIALSVASGNGSIYPWARPLHILQHGTQASAAHATAQQDTHVTDDAAHPVPETPSAAHESAHGGEDLILKKRAFLNAPFFILRWVGYFAVWAGLAWTFWKRSVRQDETGDPALTSRLQTISAPGMLAFSLTVTLASFDLLMSLDPHWFSTIFGVHFFAGSVIGFFALLITVLMALQRRGVLTHSVNVEHYHDLGKLLFGFVFFWGYIAFSQYMLIWYGNIPEETGWFIRRGCAMQAPNVWSWVIVTLLIAHFIVPFVVLLSRNVKRSRTMLGFWAVWMLVLHWVDLYWLVMPELTTAYLPLGLLEIGCLVGLSAIFVAGLARVASMADLLPSRDPRLAESLAFKNF